MNFIFLLFSLQGSVPRISLLTCLFLRCAFCGGVHVSQCLYANTLFQASSFFCQVVELLGDDIQKEKILMLLEAQQLRWYEKYSAEYPCSLLEVCIPPRSTGWWMHHQVHVGSPSPWFYLLALIIRSTASISLLFFAST